MDTRKKVIKISMFVLSLAILIGLYINDNFLGDDGDHLAGVYPKKTIEFVVPVAAGAELDLYTRAMLQGADFGVNTVVVNKPGGSQSIGLTEIVMRKGDGYSIGIGGGPGIVVQPLVNDKLIYNETDFKFIFPAYDKAGYILLSTPNSEFQTLDDVIKAIEGGRRIKIATPNTLSVNWMIYTHFFGELGKKNGFDYISMIDEIPSTSGTAGAQTDLLGGHVDLYSANDGTAKNLAAQGQAICLLSLSDAPNRYFPELIAAGPDFDIFGCENYAIRVSFLVNKDVPDEIVSWLADKVAEAARSQVFQDFLISMNTPLDDFLTPDDLGQIYRNNKVYIEKLLQDYGVIE